MSRRLNALLTICLLLATASLAGAQDWTGRGRTHGYVKDEDGKPIQGAKVQVFLRAEGNGPEPAMTNKKGYFAFGGLDGGTWTILVDADGFKGAEGTLTVNPFGSSPPAEFKLARDAGFSINQGDALIEAGKYAEAREQFMVAMAGLDEVGQARLCTRIGDTYMKQGDLAAARAEYQKALPYLAPEEQTGVRINLGNAYQAAGEYAAARSEYEKVLPSLEGDSKALVLTQIAKGYGAEGNQDQAIEKLKMAVEASPGNQAAIQVLADLLTRQGKEEEAAQYLAQLPDDAVLPTDMVLNIGIRLYNEGDAEKALGYFDRAIKEAPDNPEGYYYRGLSYLGLGRNDEARADFEKLLEIDPGSSHAGEVQEFLSFLESGS